MTRFSVVVCISKDVHNKIRRDIYSQNNVHSHDEEEEVLKISTNLAPQTPFYQRKRLTSFNETNQMLME